MVCVLCFRSFTANPSLLSTLIHRGSATLVDAMVGPFGRFQSHRTVSAAKKGVFTTFYLGICVHPVGFPRACPGLSFSSGTLSRECSRTIHDSGAREYTLPQTADRICRGAL